MPEYVPFFRVFVSSPGDVNDERKAVLEALERLPNRPAFRERVGFRVVAWDKLGADTPMLATMSPQAAIDEGLPKPSECDIVVCIFWSRMGTPFVMEGVPYESGTHYELLDALNSERPHSLIYRRTEKKLFEASDKVGQEQYNRVQEFFSGELFYDPVTKQIRRGVNPYESPANFRERFETHLEELVVRLLRRFESSPTPLLGMEEHPLPPTVLAIGSRRWQGSPFPGLRSFSKEDDLIYFGREHETDALVKRVAESRFVAVVGASGSGKSSLVHAGLLPRLEANAISNEFTGSKDWFIVQFTPGQIDHPFAALFEGIIKTFEPLRPTPFEMRRVKTKFVEDCTDDPLTVLETLLAALEVVKAPAWAETLLFIDQFEELFTPAAPDNIAPFSRMLSALVGHTRFRVVITIRHDFVHRAIEVPELAELLNMGSLHLAAPTPAALSQMIKRPAELAALEFEDGLPKQILSDIGDQSGALALMAYLLDELYKIAETRSDRRLTFADYAALDGVQGAIGKRAEQVYARLPLDNKETVLGRTFRDLVEVDERGIATRQHCPIERFDEEALMLVRTLTDARLLVMDETKVEVAHEALFRSWERLKNWIAEAQEDLILLRQIRPAATEWVQSGKPDFLLWPYERQKPVFEMLERQQPTLNDDERGFIEPEHARLLRDFIAHETPYIRLSIIDRWDKIGVDAVSSMIKAIPFAEDKRETISETYLHDDDQDGQDEDEEVLDQDDVSDEENKIHRRTTILSNFSFGQTITVERINQIVPLTRALKPYFEVVVDETVKYFHNNENPATNNFANVLTKLLKRKRKREQYLVQSFTQGLLAATENRTQYFVDLLTATLHGNTILLDFVVGNLEHPSEHTRYAMLQLLGKLSRSLGETPDFSLTHIFPILITHLNSDSPRIQELASEILLELTGKETTLSEGEIDLKKYLQISIQHLGSDNPRIQELASQTLLSLTREDVILSANGVDLREYVQIVAYHIESENIALQINMLSICAKLATHGIYDTAVIPSIIAITTDDDSKSTYQAIVTLDAFFKAGVHHEGMYDSFVHALNSKDVSTRVFAIEALGNLGDLRAIFQLEPLLNDETSAGTLPPPYGILRSGTIAMRAAAALAKLGNSKGISHLSQVLRIRAGGWGHDPSKIAERLLTEVDTPESRAALDEWRQEVAEKSNKPADDNNSG